MTAEPRGASTRAQHLIGRLGAIDALQLELPAPTAAGRDLSGDHPVFDLTPEVRTNTRAALDRGETHYADVPGVAELRDAASRALRAWGLNVDGADGLVITAGEQEGRFLAIQMLAHLGYRVVLPEVVHPGARKAAALGRVDVERVAVDPATLMPDLSSVRRALAGGRVALYLESPNRLTGRVIDRGLVTAIAEEVARSRGIIIWDAALSPWVPDDIDYAMVGALQGMADHTVTIGSLWAGTGIEGWLAAYMAGPPSLLAQGKSLKQILAICTTTPAQWAALGALQTRESEHRARRDLLLKHKRNAVALLPSAVLPGEAASVIAVRLPRSVNLTGLPALPMRGDAFGAPGSLRFTVTPAGEVVDAVRSLAGALS
ncbi:MAG: aminotransferase class I/II-fold pyridoxal phosphate-dependent enzyme [bacterium]